MAGPIRMDIHGVDPVVRRLRDPRVIGDPIRDFYKSGTNLIRRNWYGGAPVGKTRRYRKSIRRSGVSRKRIPKVAKVYSRYNVSRFLEHGTTFISARRIALRALDRSMPAIRGLVTKFQVEVLRRMRGRV